jgi:predicted nucleic acid-binding protein
MRAEDPDLQERRQVGDLPKATLIDTSAWILALRKEVSSRAIYEVDRRIEGNRAATAGIITLELLSGTRTEREYQELKEDLEALIQLETTYETWKRASHLAYELRRKGLTVPSTDVLIMTVAVENGCSLLHADHHFDLMSGAGIGLPPSEVISLLTEEAR